MVSSAAVTQSMQRITAIKMAAVEKQRQAVERRESQILKMIENEKSHAKRVQTSLECFGRHKLSLPPSLPTKTVREFLEQSEFDSSMSNDLFTS